MEKPSGARHWPRNVHNAWDECQQKMQQPDDNLCCPQGVQEAFELVKGNKLQLVWQAGGLEDEYEELADALVIAGLINKLREMEGDAIWQHMVRLPKVRRMTQDSSSKP